MNLCGVSCVNIQCLPGTVLCLMSQIMIWVSMHNFLMVRLGSEFMVGFNQELLSNFVILGLVPFVIKNYHFGCVNIQVCARIVFPSVTLPISLKIVLSLCNYLFVLSSLNWSAGVKLWPIYIPLNCIPSSVYKEVFSQLLCIELFCPIQYITIHL